MASRLILLGKNDKLYAVGPGNRKINFRNYFDYGEKALFEQNLSDKGIDKLRFIKNGEKTVVFLKGKPAPRLIEGGWHGNYAMYAPSPIRNGLGLSLKVLWATMRSKADSPAMTEQAIYQIMAGGTSTMPKHNEEFLKAEAPHMDTLQLKEIIKSCKLSDGMRSLLMNKIQPRA